MNTNKQNFPSALAVFWLSIAVGFCSSAFAEFGQVSIQGTNPANNLSDGFEQVPTAQNVSANGIEAGVLNNTVFNQGMPEWRQEIPTVDMSDKYGDTGASGYASAGAAAAFATGGVLLAEGYKRVGSIFLPESIAGAMLIAKGMLEMFQGAATTNALNGNKYLENQRLRYDPNASQYEYKPFDQTAFLKDKIDTPELRNLLNSRGVDPDDMIGRLAAGEFQDFRSIANAFKIPNFNDAQVAQANGIAGKVYGKDFKASASVRPDEKVLGPEKELAFDESEFRTINHDAFVSSSREANVGEVSEGTQAELGESALGGASGAHRGLASLGGSSSTGKNSAATAGIQFPWKKAADKAKAKQLQANQRAALSKLGVQKLRTGQHIFKRAHQSYRSFGRWRKKPAS